jgi:hypothetical protein
MRLFFKVFDSKMASREKLFKAAVEFANQVGRDQLLTLSHSEDRDNIVLTIWYWADEEIKPKTLPPGTHKSPLDRAATPRPATAGSGTADLPGGLSGGFAGLSKNAESEAERALSQTPFVPPSEMGESNP